MTIKLLLRKIITLLTVAFVIGCESEPVPLQAGNNRQTSVDKDGLKTKLPSTTVESEFSLVDIDFSKICNDTVLTTATGVETAGTRDCTVVKLPPSCENTGEIDCLLDAEGLVALKSEDLSVIDLRKNVAIGGLVGTLDPKPVDCSTNAETGCVTTDSYKSADLSNLLAEKILSGVVIAGTTGSYIPDFPELANVKTSDTVNGSPGTLAECASDGQTSCIANANFKAVDMTIAIATNIKTSTTLAGVSGSFSGAALPDCATDGEVGCTTVAAFKAADMSVLIPENIKSGITISGQAGGYPSATYPLAGATAAADLTAATMNTKLASATAFEFFDSAGNLQSSAGDANLIAGNIESGNTIFGITGSVTASPSGCTSNSEVGCVATSSYKAADLTNLSAGNIKNSISIAGVTGNIIETPGNCSSDAEVGCVTVAGYKAADMGNVTAGTIKSGTTIAGISGDYPSATFPLSGASVSPDLTLFVTQMTSDGSFEYWDSAGVRRTGSGDSELASSNIKNGVQIESLGITGSFVGYFRTCAEILSDNPSATSGVYQVDPDGNGSIGITNVYCDMTEDGGGWTLIATSNAVDATLSVVTSLTSIGAGAIFNQELTTALGLAASSVRINGSGKTILSANDNYAITQIRSYQSLHDDSTMGAPTTHWSGDTSSIGYSCSAGNVILTNKIYHSCGIAANLHWQSNVAGWSNSIFQQLNLWVK